MSRENINPEDLRVQIGRKLKKARIEKGFTQEDIGEKLGVTRVVVGMYERGRLRISIQLLVQLSKLLEKPIQYFVEEDKETVEKFEQKSQERSRYNLQDNVEFSLEMALRSYLRSNGLTTEVSLRTEKLLQLIRDNLHSPL
jgi:transcriptional regulator with XRE-family HTH domain